ncbi:hypothetical protein ACPPVW_18650 [Leifsonia sp. McL0607]|uniref:hypothetical protein n=1 Tax=Leifsonia sp. McL0607 TaxID=3415672 RepID=UPI003CF91523
MLHQLAESEARAVELVGSYPLASDPTTMSIGLTALLLLIVAVPVGVYLDPRRRSRSTPAPLRQTRHCAKPKHQHGHPIPVRRKTFVASEPTRAILKGGI